MEAQDAPKTSRIGVNNDNVTPCAPNERKYQRYSKQLLYITDKFVCRHKRARVAWKESTTAIKICEQCGSCSKSNKTRRLYGDTLFT